MGVQTASHSKERSGSKAAKFLTFILDKEEYAVGILKVREIIGMIPITHIPGTSPYVRGVINLRGRVLPVIDLRIKFGLGQVPYSDRTCIIMIEIDTGDDTVLVGIIVDTVSEVLSIADDAVQAPPSIGTPLSEDFILGMAQTDTGVKIIVNIDKLVTRDDISVIGRENRDKI